MSTATKPAVGTNSRSSSKRFEESTPEKLVTPVRLPPGWLRLATRPSVTGSPLIRKTIGTGEGAGLAGCAASTAPATLAPPPRYRRRRHDRRNSMQDQIGSERGQSIIVIFRPAVFDRHILPFN